MSEETVKIGRKFVHQSLYGSSTGRYEMKNALGSSLIFVLERQSTVNVVKARIQAQTTILTGKNVHPVVALERNVMLPALNVEERVGCLSDADEPFESPRALITRCSSFS